MYLLSPRPKEVAFRLLVSLITDQHSECDLAVVTLTYKILSGLYVNLSAKSDI